ncbi:hypothetical protein C0585_07715 [Candidatus Woesearchaeota archaeon]|nr:MAG: hypothetical protein C0585_07715 [Candidatus Woesearchaeota archaeon]
MSEVKLEIGMKNGKSIYISEVESGLHNDIVCPCCKTPLIANKGGKKAHHFSHQSKKECGGALESSLHLVAKEILEESKEFWIPHVDCGFSHKKKYGFFSKARKLKIESVKIEKKINLENSEKDIDQDFFVPDIIFEYKGRKLIVEIFVTHKTPEEKIVKIKKSNISAIEIDLSKFSRNIDINSLKHKLIYGIKNKKWLHNEKTDFYFNQIGVYYEKLNKNPINYVIVNNHESDSYKCPLGIYKYKGENSVLWKYCKNCEFYFGGKNEHFFYSTIKCIGPSLVSKIGHIGKSKKTLSEEWIIKVKERFEKDLKNNICPKCGRGKLYKSKEIDGKKLRCTNFRNCHFSYKL